MPQNCLCKQLFLRSPPRQNKQTKQTMAAKINDLHITCGCRMELFLGLGKFMAGEASARRHSGDICDLWKSDLWNDWAWNRDDLLNFSGERLMLLCYGIGVESFVKAHEWLKAVLKAFKLTAECGDWNFYQKLEIGSKIKSFKSFLFHPNQLIQLKFWIHSWPRN